MAVDNEIPAKQLTELGLVGPTAAHKSVASSQPGSTIPKATEMISEVAAKTPICRH